MQRELPCACPHLELADDQGLEAELLIRLAAGDAGSSSLTRMLLSCCNDAAPAPAAAGAAARPAARPLLGETEAALWLCCCGAVVARA